MACALLASLILTLPPSLKAATTAAGTATTTTTSTTTVQLPNFPSWKGYISNIPAPKAGCFKATYPSTVWQPSQCGTAPLLPLLPSPPSTVGDGNDEVAHSSGPLIGSAVGSFPSVSGLTSETDVCVYPCGPPDVGYGANYFGLQVNTQFFTGVSTPYTNYQKTEGWEQFVFINDPTGAQGGSWIFIQYWLLGYQRTYGSCPPPSASPPGGAWLQYQGNCYANGNSQQVSSETASNLAYLSLEGYAKDSNSNDGAIFCDASVGYCWNAVTTYQVVNLYQYWTDAEFNVFGYCCGSQAQFNPGTSITVLNTLKDQSGNVIVPSCVNAGYTGETNNLNLGSCSSNGNGQIVFTESNVGTTYSATFAESGIPSGTTWGVTVGGTHQTSSGIKGITVSGLTGTVSYSYDSPVWGSGGSYSCTSSCSGSVTGAGTVTATYISPFDFRLSNSGSTSNLGGISVAQGSSGSITIAVSLVSGSTETVSLSCSGAAGALPTGVSCSSFSPGSGSPPFSSTLTVFASSSTPTGYYTLKVTGTAGALSRSTLFVLNVT